MRKNYLVLSLFILILMAAMPANASTFDNLVYQGTLLNSEGLGRNTRCQIYGWGFLGAIGKQRVSFRRFIFK